MIRILLVDDHEIVQRGLNRGAARGARFAPDFR